MNQAKIIKKTKLLAGFLILKNNLQKKTGGKMKKCLTKLFQTAF